ncbi:MAG: type II toxin-antitoxin system HicA family toxin [Spirochaetaceae bacterium]|nr:type II toxin-antitoxin system HicA family toxin [Spirochaetaceae bacterium]MBO4726964.1 type II toxin-antitoxin system HicA family toxin [Spirochaetaceae bacterium]MBR4825794.1 type II toxin-antitoxin system HicA family toxin [Spirochaetaceae bacterium]
MDAHKRAVKALNEAGYFFKRTGANHDIYFNAEKRRIIPLKRHDFDESDLRYIEKEIRQEAKK